MINTSQKTTSFDQTPLGNNGFFIRRKRGPFSSSSRLDSSFFGQTHVLPTTPVNRSPPVLLCKLAKYHSRSVYSKCSSRLQNLFSLQTGSTGCSTCVKSKCVNQGRNIFLTKKASNQASSVQPRRFLSSFVSGSEKRRWPETSVRLECTKPVYRSRTFQDGKSGDIEVPSQQSRLYDKYRPDGCLPDGPHSSRLSKISSVFVRRQNLSVYGNAIRSELGSQAFHKSHEACCSSSTESRSPLDYLSGRHSDYRLFDADIKSSQKSGHQLTGISRFSNKLQQIKPNTIPTNCVLGNGDRFGFAAIHIAPSKIGSSSEGMSSSPKHNHANCSTFVSRSRTPRVLSSSDTVCPTSLSSTTNASDSSSSEVVKLQCSDRIDTSCQSKPIMVDISPAKTAGESNCTTTCGSDHLFRRFQTGMGSILGQQTDRRLLERGRVAVAHKHIRTSSGLLCPQILSSKSDKQSGLPENGQYDGSILRQQYGRNSLPSTTSSSLRNLGLVREEESISSGAAHPRQSKCRSGPRVPSETGSERLEVTSKGDSTSNQTLYRRSLCLATYTPTNKVCQLETGSERNPHRCVHDGLVESHCLCFPSIQFNPCSTPQSKKGKSNASVSSTSVDHPTLVASTDRTNCGLPNIPGEQSPITTGCIQSRSGTPPVSLPEVSRMENIRQHFRTMGISENAVKLLCNNVKTTTTKTYNVSWTQWTRWCSERKIDPVLCPVPDILTFLAEQFDKGKEYRTVNVLRSAISSAHLQVDNKPVGQHPLVVRLMKGVSISRPPQPRYEHTWDVSVVTSYLAQLGENSELSMKQLSQKLCMLMALTCPERSSIMVSLNINYMRHYPEGVRFSHTSFRKRTDSGNLGESVYPKFIDRSLCPVACLKVYLERTKNWRHKNDDKPLLFLSFKKPHKPVSPATLSRWLKEIIRQSGIESIFKGHSVRGASTSAAKAAGLSIDTIISMADWTNKSTFNKFYYRPSLPVKYGTSVLSNLS